MIPSDGVALWWRDDDAVAVGPRLLRLLALTTSADIPLFLAVIPERLVADKDAARQLARLVAAQRLVYVLQHGYSHRNYAQAGCRASEFPAHRPSDAVRAELLCGFRILSDYFGPLFYPVLVPPWNRMAPCWIDELGGIGFRYLSGAPDIAGRLWRSGGVMRVDTQLDPIDWRGKYGEKRCYRGRTVMHRRLSDELAKARQHGGPLGLLTHHRDHDEPGWRFLSAIARWTRRNPDLYWCDPFRFDAATRPVDHACGGSTQI